MAAFTKFEDFVRELCVGGHNLDGTDTIAIYLAATAAAPSVSADAVKADIAEIAVAGGYLGFNDATCDTLNTGSEATGTFTVVGTDRVITATAAGIAAFQYVILGNTTPATPLDPLIGWWDYGSAVTLASGETFTVDFGASMFTVA